MSVNLYEFIKNNNFRGVSLGLIRRFAVQLLASLQFLRKQRIIHCDLKPENILLKKPNRSGLNVIDRDSLMRAGGAGRWYVCSVAARRMLAAFRRAVAIAVVLAVALRPPAASASLASASVRARLEADGSFDRGASGCCCTKKAEQSFNKGHSHPGQTPARHGCAEFYWNDVVKCYCAKLKFKCQNFSVITRSH